jgi:hypothetical protein
MVQSSGSNMCITAKVLNHHKFPCLIMRQLMCFFLILQNVWQI